MVIYWINLWLCPIFIGMIAPNWAHGPHKLARFPSWDPCMNPGYWAQYFNALPSSDRCLMRSCPDRTYTFVFCPPLPSTPLTNENPLVRHFFAYAEIIFALILVFPACSIEVQHNNENSPTIHCNKQSHIYYLNQSVYLLFHSNASETQAVHNTFEDEIVAGIHKTSERALGTMTLFLLNLSQSHFKFLFWIGQISSFPDQSVKRTLWYLQWLLKL